MPYNAGCHPNYCSAKTVRVPRNTWVQLCPPPVRGREHLVVVASERVHLSRENGANLGERFILPPGMLLDMGGFSGELWCYSPQTDAIVSCIHSENASLIS